MTRRKWIALFCAMGGFCLSCAVTDHTLTASPDGTSADTDSEGTNPHVTDSNGIETESDFDDENDGGAGGQASSMGPGTANEYVPDDENSNGVGVDDGGWLQLNVSTEFLRNELWVANSGEGTVSRIDADQVVEIARYKVGMGDDRADPSRTSVDLIGDVFIGNRSSFPVHGATSSVSKIAADHSRCIDRNGNGQIDTSTGPDHILPRSTGTNGTAAGQSTDECVVWTRSFDPADPDGLDTKWGCTGLRGVSSTAETGNAFEFFGHVWIGCQTERAVYKLNGNTGDLMDGFSFNLSETDCPPYGFMVDSDERLWVACRGSTQAGVQWLNGKTGESNLMPKDADPYGMAMDKEGNVWIATWAGTINRYSPSLDPELASGFWEELKVTDSFRGIAVDEDGFVWAIDTLGPATIYLIDPLTFPKQESIIGGYALADPGQNFWPTEGNGVAIDFAGNVWGISMNGCSDSGCATRLEIDRTGGVPAVVGTEVISVGKNAYTYSDMAGYHLRHFTTEQGWYRQRFAVCPEHSTKWQQIHWQADIPAGTNLNIRARAADFEDELNSALWVSLVGVPADVSPKNLPANLPEGRFIELEIRLATTVEGLNPSVGAITFGYTCTRALPPV